MSKTTRAKSNETQEDEGLKELLIDEFQDLYHAENQLVKALPKMAKAANDPKLKKAFEDHLKQTEGHIQRLEKAFELLDEKAKGKPCKGMMGLVEEGSEQIQEGKSKDSAIADLALIAAAQKVEHYEISGYGSVRTMAEQLGQSEVADLLRTTEEEEKGADELLTQTAKPMFEQIGQE